MKILPRNRRKAKWFPYQHNRLGWMHFERSNGSIDRLSYVPREYADEIRSYWITSEQILYSDFPGNSWKRFDINNDKKYIEWFCNIYKNEDSSE